MLDYLDKDQFEELRQHLIVPMAMGDILFHDLAIEADMQYGLHMALSEIDPDSALLAIALCARDIAEKSKLNAPIASALQIEAENVISEYGPTWLRHYKNGHTPEGAFESILETVPEDLEALSDLLDSVRADIEDETSAAFILAELLSIQARAHMEIADFILEEMEFEKASKASEEAGNGALEQPDVIDMDAHTGNNILLFPAAAH